MNYPSNWQHNSLAILLNQPVQTIPKDSSHVVRRCLQLQAVPVNELTTEDLRLLIGQHIGLDFLVPLTLPMLSKDILAEGDYYPGDLLQNVLKIEASFWKNHSDLYERLKLIVTASATKIEKAGITIPALFIQL